MAGSDLENQSPSKSNRSKKRVRVEEGEAPKKSKSNSSSKKRAHRGEEDTSKTSSSKHHTKGHATSKKDKHRQSDVDKENTKPSDSLNADPRNPLPSGPQPSSSIGANVLVGPTEASDEYPSTPPNRVGPSATVQVSPRSRIHRGELRLGDDDWLSLAARGARVVDKSLAIKRVMDYGDKVKLGLAPRRSGKSTFISMLAAFLSIYSATSEKKRRELFETYNLYLLEEGFFNAHFAKYPVIFLSFKSDTRASYSNAMSYLKGAAINAVEPYVSLLRRRLSALKAVGENDSLESDIWTSILSRVEGALLTLGGGKCYTEADVTGLIPLVMKALSLCPGMEKPVVLIDEYDKPLVHALCDDSIDPNTRKDIHGLYTSFYSEIFKSNDHLEFGIMLGVFNVPLKTGGSGLNNIETFLAHTGISRPSLVETTGPRPWPHINTSTNGNPFEEALNLTVNDVWGLVNDHIDRLEPTTLPDASTAELAELKQTMLAHCLKSYDGYTYGRRQTVFNTYCVLKFFKALGKCIVVPEDNPSAHYYWSQTGSITMIRSLRADNAQEFLTYVDRLSREYVQRHSYLYGSKSATGILAEKLKELDIGDQPEDVAQSMDASLPFSTDHCLFELASICYDEGRSSLTDWGSSGLSVGAIFRQLYQAGYLTPRDNGAIGIPNEDVFHAFQHEAESIFSASGLAGGILDPTLHAIGIGAGDFVRFASYVNSSLATSLRVSKASMREDYYHGWLQALLTPLRYHGFDQRAQVSAEGGYSDLELIPLGRNTLFGTAQANELDRPYIIFELKRLACEKSLETAMTETNRKKVLGQAKRLCKTAMTQINERYKHSRLTHADGSSALYLVGLTFWRQRFLMRVSRLVPRVGGIGLSAWKKQPYEATETAELTTSSVRMSIKDGDLVANTIFTE